MEGARDTGLKNVASTSSLKGMDDFDLSKLLHKPRLNIERQRSFDERSLSELSIGLAARAGVENLEAMNSPGGRSSYLDTPAPSSRNSFDPHAMVAEAWDALRRSLVYFRGHPVGTVAALDYTEEALNYERAFEPSTATKPTSVPAAATCRVHTGVLRGIVGQDTIQVAFARMADKQRARRGEMMNRRHCLSGFIKKII
uniref:Alkaline/neutral invertase n=1 Tax=Nelumbo nucifera TaxID=4432 RepID=A0A822XH24_NELNU|nr:TPA_asm: hypothetical protein HUJ06_020715 [Nelumbo nucifera]